MNNKSESIEIKRRRLLFRSKHRGTKEMDILLGDYFDKNLENFSIEELKKCEEILDQPDDSLYRWALARVPVPQKLLSSVLIGFIESVRRRGDSNFSE